MGSRVELFERIRRDHEFEGLSVRALARRHGVHRRAVRQALGSAVPPPRRVPAGRPAPALGAYRAVIDEWLLADRDAPVKQRHTAKRIHARLVDEHGAGVAETTVRQWVRKRRRELGLSAQAFCPQVHDPGVTAEVDWGEAKVLLAGQLVEVGLFLMRACFSGAGFVMAFERQTQQAFLEGHVHALEWFGGAFDTIRYDNLRSAAKKVLKGRRRVESDRLVALRSHYLFESWFTLVGIEGAHEKGGVEGEVGRFRRNHLVPVPEVCSLGQLNALILEGVNRDLGRRIEGRQQTVAQALAVERERLRALPGEPFCTWEQSTHRVNNKSMVVVRANHYSVPVALVGARVLARVGAREVTVVHEGREVARHVRRHTGQQYSAQLSHYLQLLERKPGALRGSLALRQERENGRWPDCYDELWAAIEQRVGASQAARQIVDVLMLAREHGAERVELAVRGVLAAGAYDGRAVAVLLARAERAAPAPLEGLDERLPADDQPEPDLSEYDRLLHGREGSL